MGIKRRVDIRFENGTTCTWEVIDEMALLEDRLHEAHLKGRVYKFRSIDGRSVSVNMAKVHFATVRDA